MEVRTSKTISNIVSTLKQTTIYKYKNMIVFISREQKNTQLEQVILGYKHILSFSPLHPPPPTTCSTFSLSFRILISLSLSSPPPLFHILSLNQYIDFSPSLLSSVRGGDGYIPNHYSQSFPSHQPVQNSDKK